MTDATAQIHTDGAARGNPGPAAWAYVIAIPGRPPVEAAERMGEATNNVAEYTALIHALQRAAELQLRQLEIFSDSELMVKQLRGEYAVKNAELRVLHDQAQELLRRFDRAAIAHVRRAENKRTDALCNKVLNRGSAEARREEAKSSGGPAQSRNSSPRKPAARRRDVDADAIECLRSAASAWSRSGGSDPPPELVWEQLWSILQEAGALKKPR